MAQPIAVSKPAPRPARFDQSLSEVSTEEIYRELLSRLGEDPAARDCWPRRDASRSRWIF